MQTEYLGTATYSPEDNKLRLYPFTRLSREDYDKVKSAGFTLAPKQELFVAPMWTPEREDLLIELCGEIGDEDKSLIERAEERSDRFADYSEKRLEDATRAREGVAAIADNIPLGQPILVGHHSERHARKDAERIENGMRKAVKMWETSEYWKQRARGCVRAAKYKERPDVRARRIKGLESDKRKQEKLRSEAKLGLKFWSGGLLLVHKETKEERALAITDENQAEVQKWCGRDIGNVPVVRDTREGFRNYWNAYDVLQPDGERYQACPAMRVSEVQPISKRHFEERIARHERWIAHIDNRLAYESEMLKAEGFEVDRVKSKSAASMLPLLNYRQPKITCPNRYEPGEYITYEQVEMTAAEYAAINKDYKATCPCENSHRIRTAMLHRPNSRLVAVFLTDSKVHEKPAPLVAPPRKGWVNQDVRRVADGVTPPPETLHEEKPAPEAPKANAEDFKAMRETLKAGVQVVTAPQLFPTPEPLARRMISEAGLEPGQRILEPSAGTGAIVGEMPFASGVVAVEINRTLCDSRLRGMLPDEWQVRCADFLACNGDLGKFDRIVMNPPFQNGDDIKHILHARGFLKEGGRLVALCANGPRQREKLMPLASLWEDLPPGSFSEQGTNVNVALLVIDN